MNVGSLGSTNNPYAQAVQRQPEAAEVKRGGRDNDGDADDGSAKAVQSLAPNVGLNGQRLGQIINVSA